LNGKELSYNNIMDLDSAVALAIELPEVACAIIKHSNPCGVGIASSPLEAYKKALATDPVSAFGSIIAINAQVDEDTANEMKSLFVECVVAPSFSGKALEVLKEKKNLRALELPGFAAGKSAGGGYHLRGVRGGILVQEKDSLTWEEDKLSQVTNRKVTEEEKKALNLAWVVCKNIKSNGIVLARADRTIGIGTGQMSRIDSVEICMMKAGNAGLSVKESVMASDAFFPFRDGIDRVAKEGITAVVQPGGSIRDEEVIQAADEHDIAMLFTGVRHFRH
jgi:phosphoribosylaminoimidazolecarboxamide formyltransferase/IMP cyclohydrolase